MDFMRVTKEPDLEGLGRVVAVQAQQSGWGESFPSCDIDRTWTRGWICGGGSREELPRMDDCQMYALHNQTDWVPFLREWTNPGKNLQVK